VSEWLIIIIFLFCLFIKVPVPIAVGLATIYGLINGGIGIQMLSSSPYHSLNSFTLMAVPFFMFAGSIMSRGSIAQDLLDVARTFVGDKKEAIAISTIAACAFFAALCGSAVATVAALGAICIPMMVKEGYKTEYACAIAASGAIVGPIIPPSIIMCVYGVQTNTSITDLFMGGFLPGILMSAAFIVVLQLTKRRHNNIDFSVKTFVQKEKYTWSDKGKAIWKSKWSLLTPIIVLGGIYSGIVTPTEAAVICSVYVIIVSILVKRDIKWTDVYDAFVLTVKSMGGLMILLGLATVFGQMLTLNFIPQTVSTTLIGLTNNRIILLLLINFVLLIAGCFMEASACIVIFTPILLPIVKACGITTLQFGVIMCVNLVIGTMTPPFGTNLFMTSSMTKVPVFRIAKQALPFMGGALFICLLITYCPWIIDILPNLLKG